MIKYCLLFICFYSVSFAQTTKIYDIDGSPRKVIIYEQTKETNKIPVVFIFHGHGGNTNLVSRKLDFQNYYKEALIVFMEGIPGRKSKLDPMGKMNGWQVSPNDLGNRDINFFDQVFEDIGRRYKIDHHRIYVVGHSNGARFANVLWKERGDKLSAICSASAQGGVMISGALPISVWMYMGKNDKTAPYENQIKSIPLVKHNLGVVSNGKKSGDKMYYRGNYNTELVIQESDGGHEFPKQTIPEIVDFFKRNIKQKYP